jgi:UDP-N-acetylglucosamine 2-epimerase (non-hydrolysing)
MTKVVVVYGTRPEIIKLGPLVRLLGKAVYLLNTGQHFDRELSTAIAEEFGLPERDVSLDVGGDSRARQIARGLIGIEDALDEADAVIVQGDTNSALAGALAANAREVPLFHVEAGLRSNDRRMPEEHNRVLIDHLADLCWAPTEGNVDNLRAEGIVDPRVQLTGNSIVEALRSIMPDENVRASLLSKHGLIPGGFILVTLHRPENVDDPDRLSHVLGSLADLELPVFFPMHPRTLASAKSGGLDAVLESMTVVAPIGYQEFLGLLDASAFAISDSGGIQEEVSVLKVPLIVLRRSTERPEVLGTFARLTNEVTTMKQWSAELASSWRDESKRLESISSPFGDGNASIRMVESLTDYLGRS